MRANLTFFFPKIAPIFSKTAPPKDYNGSVVFYFGPSRELKWPYTGTAESLLRGHRLIGSVLTPKKTYLGVTVLSRILGSFQPFKFTVYI